jgi:hypothetical protein
VRDVDEDNALNEGKSIQISSIPCLTGLNWHSDEVDLKCL